MEQLQGELGQDLAIALITRIFEFEWIESV